jgi:hypothetical protein
MTVALVNAASALCVFLRTRGSERFWLLTVLVLKNALEPCPWGIGRSRAPDAVAANRRSACGTGEMRPPYAHGCVASIPIQTIVNSATIAQASVDG